MRRFASLDNILYCSNVFMESTQSKSHESWTSSRLFQSRKSREYMRKEGQAKILPTSSSTSWSARRTEALGSNIYPWLCPYFTNVSFGHQVERTTGLVFVRRNIFVPTLGCLIGIYLFYKNWSTETFSKEDSEKWVLCRNHIRELKITDRFRQGYLKTYSCHLIHFTQS